MITSEQMDLNKYRFLSLISQIKIPGADIEGLKQYLDSSDFFYAPASTIYHCNYEGGLCQHSLNVYDNLVKIAEMYRPGKYSSDSLLTVGLLHDISKTNFYEKYTMNKKVYNEHGSKHDNMGNFDWIAEEAFKVKDASDRLLLGTHEEASVIMIGKYIPLTVEETIAVMHHHGNAEDRGQFRDLTPHFNKYGLLTLLHMADFLSCYLDEVI